MDDIIAQIKERIAIVDLVASSGLTVVGRGRVRTTREHDSLKLWTDTGTFYWFARGVGGDILDWYQLEHRCAFDQALAELAREAGVDLRPPTAAQRQAQDDHRSRRRILELATAYYARILAEHPGGRAARDYCTGRAWTPDVIQLARLGYVLDSPRDGEDSGPGLYAILRDAGLAEHPLAKAVLSVPRGYLIYPHIVGGQVVYLSARAVAQKRHWNLPADAAGPKRLYIADAAPVPVTPVTATADGILVLVEGQADALSLAQWGVSAIALCGVDLAAGADPADRERVSRVTHVALDNDEAGQTRALEVAFGIGPLTRVVIWPREIGRLQTGGCKDANDLLRVGATAEDILPLLNAAPTALHLMARRARRLDREPRKTALQTLGRVWRDLDDLTRTDLEVEIAGELACGLTQFRRLMAAVDEQVQAEEKSERPSPAAYENSAGGACGGIVWEQCVRWDESGTPACFYAVRTTGGEIQDQATVTVGGTTFIPYPATIDLIRKKVVLFPSAAAEYGTQVQLLADVRSFIHRWLDVDTFYEQLASYYVMFTWLYDLFETLPYLRALGDYGTGKSRFLQTIGVLCYRPMFVSGASTASPIFRVIDMFRGTLVIDEADFANSDAEAEIIKIVNVGYARGGVVLRAEKDAAADTYYPSAKDVYCPKVLATRRLFQDRATESRCLTKRMSTAKPRADVQRLLNRAFWDDAQELRNRLLLYRLRSHREMEVDPNLSDMSIEPRLDQVTLALKSIISDPAMRDQISTFVRAYNATLITDRQMSVPAIVVQVLAETWYRPAIDLRGEIRDWTIKTLSERVRSVLETVDPDEKMNPRRLSSILSDDLGLTRRDTDPDTRRARVVIDEPALAALMARYGIDVPEP